MQYDSSLAHRTLWTLQPMVLMFSEHSPSHHIPHYKHPYLSIPNTVICLIRPFLLRLHGFSITEQNIGFPVASPRKL